VRKKRLGSNGPFLFKQRVTFMTLCPLCKSASIRSFLQRHSVPVHQNLVMHDQPSAVNIKKGDLDLMHCTSCDFVFNQSFDANKLSYGSAYDNTQENSSVFNTHITSLATDLIQNKGVKKARIVEVGCGKGGFLKLLVRDPEFQNSGYGYDPTYIGEMSLFEGRLKFEKCFYDERAKDLEIDVVVCRHVIEHIERPVDFLQLIKRTLVNSPHARLFFETPCLEWILKNQVIWDFFYEHCSYFTTSSLSGAFERAGFQVESVGHVFGGQYLWLEASLGAEKKNFASASPLISSMIEEYKKAETHLKSHFESELKQMSATAKVALWGAGAKGVTFANLIDPKREWIDCIIDINPNKQNFFLPGSGHPIVSYASAAKRGVKKAIVMNLNYKDESKRMLADAGIDIELI
jgi:hypothetical protein